MKTLLIKLAHELEVRLALMQLLKPQRLVHIVDPKFMKSWLGILFTGKAKKPISKLPKATT